MIKLFKYIALLEGISLLLLLFFAMPMKYIYELPIYVKVIGMALAVMLKIEEQWPIKKFVIICIASIIPFGTFYVEKKYLKNA